MGCGGSKEVDAETPTLVKKDVAAAVPSTEKPAPTEKPVPGASAFAFASPLPDCVSSNPDVYKVVAELPGARLVEMTIEPGQEDIPHDHPAHSMFFVQGGKLSITDYDTDGKSKNNAHEVEIPAGAPPIFPAGAHKVKNVGDTTVKVVFIEPYVTCQPCADIEGYVSPFEVAPQCYKVLAEDDNWITGLMTMEVGATDPVHHHKDHLIYVLEGDEVTIFPGGDESAAMSVPIKVGAGIPAPMDAPPFFKHSLKNSGSVPIKMLFFEAKTPKPAKPVTDAWVAPAGAPFHRVTKIPIKSGSMGDIKAVSTSEAFAETIKTFEGFLGVEALQIDDTSMLTHSRWVSEEACSGGAAALGSVLKGHLGPYIAGPPEPPWVGPRAADLAIADGTPGAYRVVVMNLKPSTFKEVVAYVNSKEPDFKKIDGLISVTVFSAGPTSGVVCAAYTSTATLEAATPVIGPLLSGMGPHFASPPTPFGVTVEYSTYAPPAAPASLGPFNFASGMPDCCTSNPEAYSVLAELPNFRLVEMKVPPGGADKPHDHPSHSMYFLKPAKLEITDYDESGKSKDNAHVAEVPAGACPIFPAGAHQVKNVGDEEAQVIFIEAFPMCKPCGSPDGFISPFTVAPQCYKILAENDDFYTGMMTMEPGEEDPIHNHKDHLIYVIEGGEVTISGFGGEPMVVPMTAGAAIPAPMSAPPFAQHTLKNTGSTTLKLLFFEMKL